MKNKFAMIPVILAAMLIPQLLFWWTNIADAAAFLLIYLYGTLVSVTTALCFFVAFWKRGIRKTAALAVITGVLEATLIVLCAYILVTNVSLRSASFTVAIDFLLRLMVFVPFFIGAFADDDAQMTMISIKREKSFPASDTAYGDRQESSIDLESEPAFDRIVPPPLPPRRVDR